MSVLGGCQKSRVDYTIDSTLLPFTATLTRRRRNNSVRNYCFLRAQVKIHFLIKDVFERRTSTGGDAFFRIIELEATKFVLFSVSTLTETICWKIWAKPLCVVSRNVVLSLRARSKTSLLKLPIILAPPSQKQQNTLRSWNPSNYAFQKSLPSYGLYQLSQTFLLSFSCFFEFSSFLFNSFSSLVIWASNPFFSFCHCCLRTKTHELISWQHFKKTSILNYTVCGPWSATKNYYQELFTWNKT